MKISHTIANAANELFDNLNTEHNNLQEELIQLQLAQAGIENDEPNEWVKHPEHLEQDIRETQESIQYIFEMLKQVEHFIQTIDD